MPLRLLLDENVPYSIYKYLKSKGFEVSYVLSGAKNMGVIEIANKMRATLITRDWDFSNTIMYPPEKYHGIIVLKIHPPLAEDLIEALENVFNNVEDFSRKTIIAYKRRIEVIK